MNKTEQNETTKSGLSDISTLKTSQNSAVEINEKMDRENFYHWGAIREIMEFIRQSGHEKTSRTKKRTI